MKVKSGVLIVCGTVMLCVGILCHAIIQFALASSIAEALGKGDFTLNLTIIPSMLLMGLGFLLVLLGFFVGNEKRNIEQGDAGI